MSLHSDNVHLLPLDGYDDFENSANESDDSDSIEVVSNIDEDNDIVDMTKNLVFSSDDEFHDNYENGDHSSLLSDKNNGGFTRDAVTDIHSSFGRTISGGFAPVAVNNNLSSFDVADPESDIDASDNELNEYYLLNMSIPTSTSTCHSSSITNKNITAGVDKIQKNVKRKRRQWTIEKKLEVVRTFKLNQNKHQTASQHGCSRAQLRNWLEMEVKLINLSKEKKG